MAKKRTAPARPAAEAAQRSAIIPDRFARLYRMLQFLAGGPQSRARITRHLRLDVRGFYRDLELLRKAGIHLTLAEGRYGLGEDLDKAAARLPFPDVHLTLGEAQQLAKGRGAAHRYLKEQIEGLLA